MLLYGRKDMKKTFLLLIAVCFFCGCGDKSSQMTIQGELTANRDFSGEVIYLLSIGSRGDFSVKKDSAIIEEGRFTIQQKTDTAYIALLRTKNPVQSYFLQPLLIVVEPGTLEVKLDSASYANGTPLNNTLQAWKERKASFDLAARHLRQHTQLTQHREEYYNYNYNFVKENKDNPAGQFVYKMTKSLFTEEQKEELAIPDE